MTQLELAELRRLQAETDMLRAQEEYYRALKQKVEPSYFDPNNIPVKWVKQDPITCFAQAMSNAYKQSEWE